MPKDFLQQDDNAPKNPLGASLMDMPLYIILYVLYCHHNVRVRTCRGLGLFGANNTIIRVVVQYAKHIVVWCTLYCFIVW